MKYGLSLSLLAVLTACSSSKNSDKTPTNDAPIVSIGETLDTIAPSESKTIVDNDIVVVKPVETEAAAKTEEKPAVQPVENQATESVPETFVGFGYSTVEGNVKESCLTGNVTVDGSNSSSLVGFSLIEDYDSFKTNALGLEKGSILNKWAGVDFQSQFFSELSAETLQANYVFATSIINGTKRISNTALNTGSLTPDAFHNKCGNKFINSAVVGGAFVASVNLKFVNFDAKTSFESEQFNFTKLTQILKTESESSETTRRLASVEITYAQIGGGGALVTGLNSSDLLKCSLDNEDAVQKCVKTLEKLSSYATSEEFLKSIKKAPAVYSFTLSKY